jgi:hypothetical protein
MVPPPLTTVAGAATRSIPVKPEPVRATISSGSANA